MEEIKNKREATGADLERSLQFLGLHSRILSHLYRIRAVLTLALDYAGTHPPKDKSADLDWFSVLDNLEEENLAALDEMAQLETFFNSCKSPKGGSHESARL